MAPSPQRPGAADVIVTGMSRRTAVVRRGPAQRLGRPSWPSSERSTSSFSYGVVPEHYHARRVARCPACRLSWLDEVSASGVPRSAVPSSNHRPFGRRWAFPGCIVDLLASAVAESSACARRLSAESSCVLAASFVVGRSVVAIIGSLRQSMPSGRIHVVLIAVIAAVVAVLVVQVVAIVRGVGVRGYWRRGTCGGRRRLVGMKISGVNVGRSADCWASCPPKGSRMAIDVPIDDQTRR